jgi:iron complex outermembrane receptor protein
MFHQVFKPFNGNIFVCGLDYKNIGGIGSAGLASDSLIMLHELAGYVHMQQRLSEKVSLSGGLRLEHNSLHGEQLIPFLGATYAYNARTSFKSSFSKGFRNPTIMELYLFAPNSLLKPEEMVNYEFSYMQLFFQNKLRAETVFFISKGKNLIQVQGQYPLMKRENIGSFFNQGVELGIQYYANKQLAIHSNYSYLHTEKPILAAPKHQFNLGVDYTYSIFSMYTSLQYVNDLYTSLTPHVDEDYTRLNAKITVKPKEWIRVFFELNNILNQRYEINYGYPMPGLTMQYGVSCSL